MNESYRNIMVANNSDIQHLYQTLEDMLESKPCTLHPLNHMCQSCPDGSSPSLLVTGSPCNPYSTRRAKRFAEDSISEHSMTTTTMESVVSTYRKYEPHTGIMEQVTVFEKNKPLQCTISIRTVSRMQWQWYFCMWQKCLN